MIKLAMIVPSLSVGGAENMAAQLAAQIDKRQFDVKLLVLSSKQETHITRFPDEHNIDIVYFDKSLGVNYTLILKMYKYLSTYKPDVIHTHMHAFAYVFPWVLLHRIKMLHTVHSRPIFELSHKSKKLIKILYKLKKAIPVAISKQIGDELKDLYSVNSIETIYNPVNISRFEVSNRDYNKDNPVFITVGRLEKVKNQSLLLRGFSRVVKEYPEVKLLIAGDGLQKEKLQALTKSLQIANSIQFLGIVSNAEKYLQNADVFVLTSEYEGLPLTILEAMSSGLPIISTNVGGAKDVVTDNGILIECDDEVALAEGMVSLIKNKELRKIYGCNSMKNVQPFDINNITNQYQSLYLKYQREGYHRKNNSSKQRTSI